MVKMCGFLIIFGLLKWVLLFMILKRDKKKRIIYKCFWNLKLSLFNDLISEYNFNICYKNVILEILLIFLYFLFIYFLKVYSNKMFFGKI